MAARFQLLTPPMQRPPKRRRGGQIGNKNAALNVEQRRKKRMMKAALGAIGKSRQSEDDGKLVTVTRLQRLSEALVTLAEQGDVSAYNAIANRIDGMPQQIVDVRQTVNARSMALVATVPITPAEAARAYQRALNPPDAVDENEPTDVD
jgi:hypothetical protein